MKSRILPKSTFNIKLKIRNFIKEQLNNSWAPKPDRQQKGGVFLITLGIDINATRQQCIQYLDTLFLIGHVVMLVALKSVREVNALFQLGLGRVHAAR